MALKSKKLAADSICVVGDEDQSIYSWRGATVANILNFKKDFAKTKTIKIEQNYRSVQPILDMANNIIEHNKNRNPKKLWSDKKAKDRIRLLTCLSEYKEADMIAQFLQTASNKQKLNTIAILYRTHVQSRALEEALIKNSIPYKIIGGIQFYERKEIKDMLAYLRLVVNPFDRTALFRIINTPVRGLGAKFEDQLYQLWHAEPFLTFAAAIDKIIETQPKKKQEALKKFLNVFEDLKPTTEPKQAIDQIIRKTEYTQFLKDTQDTQEAQGRIDNLQELSGCNTTLSRQQYYYY